MKFTTTNINIFLFTLFLLIVKDSKDLNLIDFLRMEIVKPFNLIFYMHHNKKTNYNMKKSKRIIFIAIIV